MSGRTFAFLVDGQEVRLPVTPSRYRWGAAQELNSVAIDAVGSVALPGHRVAHSDSVECMFPAQRYHYCTPGAVIDPVYYIRLFERLIAEKKVVRYIVEGRVNVPVLVEEIVYEERDGTKDVYATIYLTEYIELEAVTTETRSINQNGLIDDQARAAFGEQGQKVMDVVMENAAHQGMNQADAYGAFAQAYYQGQTGKEMTAIPGLTQDAQELAYHAGREDAGVTTAPAVEADPNTGTAPLLGITEGETEAKPSKVGLLRRGGVTERTTRGVNTPGERAVREDMAGLVRDEYVNANLDTETANTVDAVAKALGVRVQFTDVLSNAGATGEIQGNVVQIRKNTEDPLKRVFGHEITHRMQELDPRSYNAFRDIAGAERGDYVQGYQEWYWKHGVELTYEEALDEATADFAGELIRDGEVLEQFIQNHQADRNLLQRVLDAIRELVRKLPGMQKQQAQTAEERLTAALEASARQVEKETRKNKNAAQKSGGTRYSIDKYYERRMSQWDGVDRGGYFKMGTTSKVLQSVGLPYQELLLDESKARMAIEKHKEITPAVLAKIPEMLENPIAISHHGGKNINVFGHLYDDAGRPIMVGIRIDCRARGPKITMVSKVRTVETRTHDFNKKLNDTNVLYLNPNKKETKNWFQAVGESIPLGGTRFGLIRSIPFDTENSNTKFSMTGNGDAAQQDGKVRYSLNPEFSREFDAWMQNKTEAQRKTDGGYFRIGTTSEALKSIGVRDGNIYWRKQKIGYIMEDHPEIDAATVKSVPNILENPIIVMKSRSREDSIVLFGDVKAADGRNVMAALELTPRAIGGMEAEFSLLTSAYGRSDANIKNLVESSEILYLDPNKKRTDTWLMSLRVQFPSDQPAYGSIGSISYADGSVNIQGKRIFDEHSRNSLAGTQELMREMDRIMAERGDKSDEEVQEEIHEAVERVYQQMVSDYGAIPAGERPARQVQVPRKTNENKKVSRTVRTILEADPNATNAPAVHKFDQTESEIRGLTYRNDRGEAGLVRDVRDSALASAETEMYTENKEGVTNSVEEFHLRNSGKWTGSADSERSVSPVAQSTGGNQIRQEESRAADPGTASLTYGEAVSTASLGIGGGSTDSNIRIVTGGETAATKRAREIAKKRGLRLTLFSGDNLSIRQADGSWASVRAYISGDRVFVRVDHPFFTSDQLMRHEAGHDMIAKGEVDPDDVRARIEKTFGKGQTDEVSRLYAEAYEGSGMTADEIWEEVICDSLGDMNIFADTLDESLAQELLDETGRAAAQVKGDTARGPPAATDTNVGGKASLELDDLRDNIRKATGIKWNGGRAIELSKSEYAAVVSRISTRYHYSNTMHDGVQAIDRTTDGKNAQHYVYLYIDHGFGTYEIIGRLTYGRNDTLISFLREEIANDRTAEGISEGTHRLRNFYEHADSSGFSRHNGATHARNDQTGSRRRAEWEESDRRVGRSDSGRHDDGGNGGVKTEFSMETPVEGAKFSREPPAATDTNVGGKASRENSRRAQRGRSIEIETMENNRFERLRQFHDKLPDIWYAYTEKYLYIYRNDTYVGYTVLGKVPVTNQVLANAVIEEVQNGTIRTAEDYSRRIKGLRTRAGRYSGSNPTVTERGSTVGNGGLPGNGSGKSTGQSGSVRKSSRNRKDGGDVTDKASQELADRLRELNVPQEEMLAAVQAAVRAELDRMGADYGWIPAGERPARQVQVPRKTGENKKVSRTVRTILEAKATPKEALPDIQKLVAMGEFSYEVYSDKQAIEDAAAQIESPGGKGWPQAQRNWFDAMKQGKVSKENTTLGWVLYNNAVNSGDAKTALDVLNEMVRHQRNAAQALQATRILKKLSPETQLYNAQRSVNNLQEELTKKYGKNAPHLHIDETLAEAYLQAKTEDARDEAMRKLYMDIGRQMPSRYMDKWTAWRYVMMLGNPRTHVRNIVGNAGFAPLVMTKNKVAAGLETAVDKLSGGKAFTGDRGSRSKSLTRGERDLRLAADGDYDKVVGQIMSGGKYQDYDKNRAIEHGRVIFQKGIPTKAVEKLTGHTMKYGLTETFRRANTAALELEDGFFVRRHYRAALASYCKANGITAETVRSGKGIEMARAYAIREAQKATYRDANAFSEKVSGLGRYNGDDEAGKALSIFVEGVLPFRKTPANILARGVEYSPIGLVKGLTWDLYQVAKGKKHTSEMLDELSAGLTGTGLLMLGFWLAGEGLIRGIGAGDDEKEREFAKLQGHQDYALELPNGTSVTLDWLAPEALPFFVGVNLQEQMANKEEGEGLNMADWMTALSNISEPILEMSCLQSLNDLLSSVGYGTENGSALFSTVASAAASYLTQGLSTLLGQIERSSEAVRMTTYTEDSKWLTKDMQYALGRASARIPGLDYDQIPYIDAWGREDLSGSVVSRVLNNFLNPAYISKVDSSEMEQELQRLYDQTGDGTVFPTRAGRKITINGEEKTLTGEEYVKYATIRGQTAYGVIGNLVESSQYQDMSDEERAECVSLAYTYATAYGKTKVSDYQPDGWTAKAIYSTKQYSIPEDVYICAYQRKREIESLKDEDGDTIPNSLSLQIMEMVYSIPGLSETQRRAMFSDFGVGKSVIHYSKALVVEKLEKMRK